MQIKPATLSLIIIFLFTKVYSQILAEDNSQPKDSLNIRLLNDQLEYNFDEKVGYTEWRLYRSKDGASSMNNIVADIMREFTRSDFAFINFGDIYSDLEKGPISNLDVFKLIPFNRTLVIYQLSGEALKYIIEYSISGFRKGLAISGGIVEFDTSRYSFYRLNYFQIGDHPVYPKKIYRVVTTSYLADGHAGFKILKDGYEEKVTRTEIYLREVIRDYIIRNSPLKIKEDERWIKNRELQTKPRQNQSRVSN